MSPRSARRSGVLATALFLCLGLLAPSVASAAPSSAADAVGRRGSALTDDPQVGASAFDEIVVRDLSHSCPSGRVPAGGFIDVPSGYLFARAIDCLVWYEVTQGKTATTYAPNEDVTRRQMAVFIYRLLGDLVDLPEAPATSQFRDVPAGGEVGDAINVLASDELAELLGVTIVAGKSATSFAPSERVTRAQMGSFINRVLEGVAHYNGSEIEQGFCDSRETDPDRGCFPDEAQIPPAHRSNVASLYRFGVVTGRADGTYGPAANVNRAQMAAFLMRLMDVFVEAEFTVPPDRVVDVHVDNQTCPGSGATGTEAAPYCTIQAGVDEAGTIDGGEVTVVVHGDSGTRYAEDVVLDSGSALQVDLVGDVSVTDPAPEDLPFLDGTLEITGDARDFNSVVELAVVVFAPEPTLTIGTAGTAVVAGSVVGGSTAIAVDQGGRTAVVGSLIGGDDVAIDLTATTLTTDGLGTYVGGNRLELIGEGAAFVRAPGEGAVVDANLQEWREDNTFFGSDSGDPIPTTLSSDGGRRAIVAA